MDVPKPSALQIGFGIPKGAKMRSFAISKAGIPVASWRMAERRWVEVDL